MNVELASGLWRWPKKRVGFICTWGRGGARKHANSRSWSNWALLPGQSGIPPLPAMQRGSSARHSRAADEPTNPTPNHHPAHHRHYHGDREIGSTWKQKEKKRPCCTAPGTDPGWATPAPLWQCSPTGPGSVSVVRSHGAWLKNRHCVVLAGPCVGVHHCASVVIIAISSASIRVCALRTRQRSSPLRESRLERFEASKQRRVVLPQRLDLLLQFGYLLGLINIVVLDEHVIVL